VTEETGQVHIVRVSLSRTSKVQDVQCDTLPPNAVDELRGLTAGWRDAKKSPGRLDDLRQRLGLGGLIVWHSPESKPPLVPKPLTIPFEPLELDEGRAPLADLCGASDDMAAAGLRRRQWNRGIFRYGLPIIALAQIPNAIVQIAIHRDLFTIVLWTFIFGFIFGVFFLVWWCADQWFLVPGGLVIRKAFAGRVGESMQLHTPRDSLMIIRPQRPGHAFGIEIWRDGQLRRRRATLIEATALVAAWQSSLTPPPISQLTDLAG
jgi:hypothetical protein